MQKFGKYYGWTCQTHAIHKFDRFLHGKQGKTKVGWVLKSPVENYVSSIEKHFYIEDEHKFWDYLL